MDLLGVVSWGVGLGCLCGCFLAHFFVGSWGGDGVWGGGLDPRASNLKGCSDGHGLSLNKCNIDFCNDRKVYVSRTRGPLWDPRGPCGLLEVWGGIPKVNFAPP